MPGLMENSAGCRIICLPQTALQVQKLKKKYSVNHLFALRSEFKIHDQQINKSLEFITYSCGKSLYLPNAIGFYFILREGRRMER